ncbi:hypothetical protein [Truepera radiovictrix]|uniref:Uncharacterized protein n=1 Tax=Truepera radiovictrix (strain DSM 17093 / CIP 108686 / LMG 22925 / RQ-24) TaxID=649638 RepID=D7CTU2_TRURR|nr:hypothetical protein [Truepera radiovictrix]ADI15639.1 hypothetical protein Trad_2533 [Truepera radiovictrix DSM 17093]WMT58732.1 hypothetical protein RCV51_07245 [Truepera radiovictrix]
MGIILATLLFLFLCFIGFLLVERFVKPWVPTRVLASYWSVRTISFLFILLGAYFIMAWGYNPTVITLGMNQLILNPLRWVSWTVSALFLGASQAFLVEILREVRPRRQHQLQDVRQPPPAP